jgi:hypothetical protein
LNPFPFLIRGIVPVLRMVKRQIHKLRKRDSLLRRNLLGNDLAQYRIAIRQLKRFCHGI